MHDPKPTHNAGAKDPMATREKSIITIRDVAQAAHVSLSTTSRVLTGHGYASPETRAKVQQAAKQLGYSAKQLARNLKRNKTDTVGLMITDIVNPFYAVLADGVLSCAQRLGYHVILCATNEDERLESEYLHLLMSQRAAGIIAVPTGHNENVWAEAHAMGLKLVHVDRQLAGLPQVDVVLLDNIKGAYDAVMYLINLGHTRIGIVNGPSTTTTGRERLEGYIKAMQAAGLQVDKQLIFGESFTKAGGVDGAQRLLSLAQPPTALFAANNQLGEAVYATLRTAGLSIPEDLSVIVFDDVVWASLVHPPLTTVSQPTFDMGYMGMELVHQRLAGVGHKTSNTPRKLLLMPELIIRSSCAAPTGRTGSRLIASQ